MLDYHPISYPTSCMKFEKAIVQVHRLARVAVAVTSCQEVLPDLAAGAALPAATLTPGLALATQL